MPTALDLPDDVETLKRLLLEERAARQVDQAQIASLKLQLSYLKRQQYGQSFEQLRENRAAGAHAGGSRGSCLDSLWYRSRAHRA
jgi:hypothetical protein